MECSPLSFIGSQDREKASLVYDILFESYTRIGDSDAISGCDLITADSQAILKHSYLIEKKWDGLLKLNDKQRTKLDTIQVMYYFVNFCISIYARQSLDHFSTTTHFFFKGKSSF